MKPHAHAGPATESEAELTRTNAVPPASEERYRTLINSIDEGFCVIGMIFDARGKPVDYRFLETNPAFEKQTGLCDALGKRMREIAPQHEERWFEIYGRIALTGEPARFQNRAEQLHRTYDVYAFRWGEPKERQVAILFNDITARERAEAALREAMARLDTQVAERTAALTGTNTELRRSQAEFKDLFDHAPLGYHEVDAEGRIARINHAELTMLGYTADELVGQPVWKISANEELSRAAVQAKLAGEPPPTSFERRFRRKDGSTFPVLIEDRLVHDAAGSIVAIRAVIQDITERKRTEEALRASEAHFRFLDELANATRTLADPAEIMAVMARMLGRHLRASRCAYADVEADGEQFTILHDYTDGCASTVGRYRLSAFGARAVATLHGGQSLIIRNVNAELSPADGADTFNAIGIQAIITCPLVKDGVMCALMAVHQTAPRDWQAGEIAIVQDVVERCWATIGRRTAEEKIARLNAELEQRVIARTAELAAANADLRRSQAVFANLFVSLPGQFLVLTPDLRIVDASDAYLHTTMTTREGILGRSLFEVFPGNPDDPAATGTANLRASLDRVRRLAVPDTMAIQKYDVRRPDGVFEERYWSPINSPVLGADRTLEYIIHRVEDVTEFVRKKTHPPTADPAGLNARMEQMEAEIFLSTQRVQAANQQLAAANAELESFCYSVSHDLRAPLRGIAGFTHALSEDYGNRLDAAGQKYIARVLAASERMGHLIDDLLKLSRVSRAEFSRQPVNLSALVRVVAENLRATEPGRAVELIIADGVTVEGDARLLRIALENLLGNAWKFTARKPVARIEFGSTAGADGRTVCHIRDNGAGFDMNYSNKLFGPFQRLHTPEEFPGTGIGLATVQRIMNRHGGRVWAEARVGEGATFYFTL